MSVPCTPRHSASHLGVGGPLPMLATYKRFPPPWLGAGSWILEGFFENKYHVRTHSFHWWC